MQSRIAALLTLWGGAALLLTPVSAGLWGQWPMGGKDYSHSGYYVQTLVRLLEGSDQYSNYTAGTQKWSKQLPNGAVATGGVVLGLFIDQLDDESDDAYGYEFFVGADDGKVYCYRVNSGGIDTPMTFTVEADPVWTYTCDGDPIGTPLLVTTGNTPARAVYVSDTSGRLHCIDAETGNRIWRPADLTGQGELLTTPAHGGAAIYVGSSAGSVYGFYRYYAGTPANQDYKWDAETSGPVVSTPAVAFSLGSPGSQSEEEAYLYVTTEDAWLELWEDEGSTVVRHWRWYDDSETQECKSWAMLASPTRVYFATYNASNYKGRIYSVDPDRENRWEDNPNGRVDQMRITMLYPPQNYDIGKLVANMCNDTADNANLYQGTLDIASGNGKPTLVRVLDLNPGESKAQGYVRLAMGADADEISSTPSIWRKNGETNWLYVITANGKDYVMSPTGTVIPNGFPINLGKIIPRQDLAVDYDGAVVFTTSDGYVIARWEK